MAGVGKLFLFNCHFEVYITIRWPNTVPNRVGQLLMHGMIRLIVCDAVNSNPCDVMKQGT